MTATKPDGMTGPATARADEGRPMLGAVAACWALLLGMGLVMPSGLVAVMSPRRRRSPIGQNLGRGIAFGK